MGKAARLDLRLRQDSKDRLRAKSKYLGLSVTNFIEKVADEQIIFMDEELSGILKTYGYSLNTIVSIREDGEHKDSDSSSIEDRGCEDRSKTGGIKE